MSTTFLVKSYALLVPFMPFGKVERVRKRPYPITVAPFASKHAVRSRSTLRSLTTYSRSVKFTQTILLRKSNYSHSGIGPCWRCEHPLVPPFMPLAQIDQRHKLETGKPASKVFAEALKRASRLRGLSIKLI